MDSLWDLLAARAVDIHVAQHLRQRIERGDRLRAKLGLDPTASDLHLGHLVVLDVLRAFQDAGHTAVLIVGDFTALIGDPSGRSETRPLLSPEQVEAHARTYLDQVHRVLDPSRTEVRGNAEWLGRLDAAGVLQLMGKATVQQILQREDFAERLREGAPIGFHELLYPLLQGYDSVAVEADVELGGTDQLFNLLFARGVQRGYGAEPEDVVTLPLLEGTDGSVKMSKTAGNHIGITEAPEEIYGKVMSIPDRLTERYLRLVSALPEAEIERTLQLHPRDAKAALARAIVGRLHGAEAVRGAEADFEAKFHGGLGLSGGLNVGLSVRVDDLLDTLVSRQWVKSRRQARQRIAEGALEVNGEKVDDPSYRPKSGDLVRFGKHFFRVQ